MSEAIDTLFICGNFFGYAYEIQRQLVKRGCHVAYFDDRPATDNKTKTLIRVAPRLVRARADAYFDGIIAQLKDQPIKDVLVIKAEALSPAAIGRMRAAFPGARFTLYFWDSYRNMPADSREKAASFDRVLSFDPCDAAADPKMIYRPLFFLEEYSKLPDGPTDIDVLFFGTVHGDRYAVLKRIERALPKTLQFEKILYLPARWLYAVRSLQDPALLLADRREFIFKPKGKDEITALIARSRIVVDIERPVQNGYTMRTLEVLGARRKLITTNPEVANADFFRPSNIAIVDRKRPRISAEFINTVYTPPLPEIVQRYSLGGWLEDVMPSTY